MLGSKFTTKFATSWPHDLTLVALVNTKQEKTNLSMPF